MKFISSRELRIRPGAVWTALRREKDLVITSNGKPVAVLTAAAEDSVEDVLMTLRQGRAQSAVAALRRSALDRNANRLSKDRIEQIIRTARRSARAKAVGETES
jgi:prevent-host-death family protein